MRVPGQKCPPKRLLAGTVVIALLLVQASSAQIQLHNIYSRSARDSRAVATNIDTLLVETHADHGLATTKITMVLRPGYYNQILRYEKADGVSYPVYSNTNVKLDSIEMTTGFQLPTDFVADSMWLWVDGKPQEAYIQDRALAASQYQQIVGVRRDPALLQFSGRGYYDLRIFPTSSGVARKIAIQFHHTFDDDSVEVSIPPGFATDIPTVSACIPVTFDSSASYRYYTADPLGAIGFVQVSLSTTDANQYGVNIPGLGFGAFSAGKSLVLSGTKVAKLGAGNIVARDPSGDGSEFLWVGRDKKSQLLSVGFTSRVSESGVVFDPEPDTRIIVLDMRNLYWNWNDYYKLQAETAGGSYTDNSYYVDADVWLRAQKLALLALQNYIGPNHKFNVLLPGAMVQSVFGAPVAGTAENVAKAAKAIIAAKPHSQASTIEAMRAAASQAPKGIVVFISDLIQPYNYYAASQVTTSGKSFETVMDTVAAVVKASELTLFTVDDNWRLHQIATGSGGYRLAGVLNSYNVPYKYVIIDGRRLQIPQMPPLFGSSNPTGLSDLRVGVDGLSDIFFTNDNTGYRYWYDGPVVRTTGDVALMKSSSMILPQYSSTTALIRASGRVAIDKFTSSMNILISGKMGGLRFTHATKGLTQYTPTLSSTRPQEDVAWAFRKSEWLANDNWSGGALAIKAIGKEYHIVTRQTSLLALEPGMKLWEDTLNAQQPSADASRTVAPSEKGIAADVLSVNTIGGAPTTTQGSGIELDGVSLEAIASNSGVPVIRGSGHNVNSSMRVSAAGRLLTLVPGGVRGDLGLKLYDLRGRLVFSRTIAAGNLSGSVTLDLAREGIVAGGGFYTLVVRNGTVEQRFRVSLVNR